MNPPSFAAMRGEHALRKSVLGPLWTEMEHDENFLQAATQWGSRKMYQYFNGIPAEANLKMLSLAADLVTTGLSQYVIGEHPSIKVVLPAGVHRKEKKNETHIKDLQEALDALMWQILTYSVESPTQTVGQHALGLGRGVLAYPLIYERYPKHPMKNKYGKDAPYRKPEGAWSPSEAKRVSEYQQVIGRAMPWDVHAVHPRRVAWDIHRDPPEDVMIESRVLPGIYLQKYPHLTGINPRGRSAVFLEYCSKEHYGLWLNNQPLLTKKEGANSDGFAKNRTGILWYRMAEGGFGQQSFGNEWEHRVQGIVRGIRPAIISKMMDFNVLDIMRQGYGIPPMGVEAQSLPQAIEAARRIVFGMGQVWAHTTEERQHALELPKVPDVIFQQMDATDRLIEGHAWPEVLKGSATPGEPASGQAQRLSQGKASLAIAKRNLDQMWAGCLEDICYMVKHELEEPITLLSKTRGLVTLDPDDIVDGMRIVFDSSPATSQEKAEQRREQLTLKDAGLRSTATLLKEDPDVLDPEEEAAQILADLAMQSEGIVGMIANEAAQRVTGGSMQPAQPVQTAPNMNGAGLMAPTENMGQMPQLPPLRR